MTYNIYKTIPVYIERNSFRSHRFTIYHSFRCQIITVILIDIIIMQIHNFQKTIVIQISSPSITIIRRSQLGINSAPFKITSTVIYQDVPEIARGQYICVTIHVEIQQHTALLLGNRQVRIEYLCQLCQFTATIVHIKALAF